MKKVKALALFSTAILATASTGVYADEVISDGTTSPSTEQVDPTPAPSSSEVAPGSESNIPTPSSSSSTEAPEGSKTVPGSTEDEPTTPSSKSSEPETPSSNPEQPSTDPTEQPGEVEVPTTDGGKATVVPDTSVPTNNPNITAETAQNAGASQVGTTSQVTGQVVQNVTTQAPVVTNTGATIVSTKDGQLVLSDGLTVAPETVGATTNSDKTITVTQADGTKATLPTTGEASTGLLSLLGSLLLGGAALIFKKKKLQ